VKFLKSADVRKGITQAKFNEENKNVIAGEVFLLSLLLGHFSGSWLVFVGSFLALVIAFQIKKLAVLLCVGFSIVWGVIGFYIGGYLGGTEAKIALSILGFIMGLGANFSSLEWMEDIGSDENIDHAIDHVIIPCDKCGRKLRFPKTNKELVVTCPICKYTFTYKNNS
jgi:hypothetical protein